MQRVVSPPIDQFNKLRQPLNEGETLVFNFFHTHLPIKWEIYVTPHLNGLRPDFVLLHPEVGIAVFEVKDWDLDKLERWVEERPGKPPILMGRKDGPPFPIRDNPVEKIIRYKQEIQDLYCPRLDQRSGLAVITAGIIFPSADDQRISTLLEPCLKYRNMTDERVKKYYPIAGKIALRHGELYKIFPEAGRDFSSYMSPALAADLRLWLVEPDAPVTQRTPLELDAKQRIYATTRTPTGYRRITGPAGSGKSIVLAARVAQLVAEDKEVLVITFNITLINYLADTAVRNNPSARKKATWLNFHSWCKRICQTTGHLEEYKKLPWKGDDFPDEELCALVESIIDSDNLIDNGDEKLVEHYDAIIVDEGQDFRPKWWNLLGKICKPGGEMLMAADPTQDIYGTSRAWTDVVMKGAGFRGNWVKLNVSYRLPLGLISYVRDFGMRFLPNDSVDLPPLRQFELNLDCQLRWVQVNTNQVATIAAEEIWTLFKLPNREGLSVSDLTVLVDNEKLGKKLLDNLSKNYKTERVDCIDTFVDDLQNQDDKKLGRRKKLAFFMGDARIKATTLHSFKGWETRALLICIEQASSLRNLALLYTGFTRLKKHPLGSFLTVVCGESTLIEYGHRWPDFVDRDCSIDTPAPRYW